MKIHEITFLLLLAILSACVEKDLTGDKPIKISSLAGKAEKGPFTQGATVTIHELTKELKPTGKLFQTEIKSNEGDFALESAAEFVSPYVNIACDGYFFNEITGNLSNSQIRLESIVDISGKRNNINVNILTHLSKDRIIKLMKEGKNYEEATAQTREELLSCFGLQEYKDLDFEDFSISSGDQHAGVLIMISSILLSNLTEAYFTEFISVVKNDFTDSGTLSDSIQYYFREESLNLPVEQIAANIKNRYQDLGKTIEVPDLNYFIDWDGDGIAGNEWENPDTERQLNFGIDTLRVGKDGGNFKVAINANIPFTLHTNKPGNGYIEPESIFSDKVIVTDTLIQGDELSVNIRPATGPFQRPATIRVVSFDKKTTADLVILQDGDFSNEFSNNLYIRAIMGQITKAFDFSHTLEALYSNCFTTNNFAWEQFTLHNITPTNQLVKDTWSALYSGIVYLNLLEENTGRHNFKYTLALRTLLCGHLISLWGDVPYLTTSRPDPTNLPGRKSKTEIYSILKNGLQECLTIFPAGKTNSYFQVSTDVIRTLLAKTSMQEGNYQEALSHLQAVISGGRYALSNNRQDAVGTASTEILYAINTNTLPLQHFSTVIENSHYLPLILYADVILSAAECAHKTGQLETALIYLNQVRLKNGEEPATHASFEADLKATWKSRLKGSFSYFDFLKRNDWAMNELNIQAYQLLLPIPQSETDVNPNVPQNPGY